MGGWGLGISRKQQHPKATCLSGVELRLPVTRQRGGTNDYRDQTQYGDDYKPLSDLDKYRQVPNVAAC